MAKYKYDLLLMTQPKTLLQEGDIMMDHHLLFMTRSSSTTKSQIVVVDMMVHKMLSWI